MKQRRLGKGRDMGEENGRRGEEKRGDEITVL